MYQVVELLVNWRVELERPQGQPPGRVLLRQGTKVRAEVRPRVLVREKGQVPAADLCFEDGTTALGVPAFAFISSD